MGEFGRYFDVRIGRRALLRALALAGGAGALGLVAASCGGAASPSPAATSTQAEGSPTATAVEQTSTPTPTPTPTPSPVASLTSVTAVPATAAPSPTPSPAATAITEGNMARVALVKTDNRQEGVQSVLDLLGINPVQGKRVVLKPNFNTADPTPGSTHNDTLRALVLRLEDMGATGVTVAERSGPPDTAGVMQQKGIPQLAQELGFELVNLQEVGADAWVLEQPKGSHWSNGFLFSKYYKDAESIVQTCCLKTHAYGGHFTMSLKLSVGMVPYRGYNYMSELHGSQFQRQMIAEINTAYRPDLIVLDGVEAFTSGGPDQGTRANANVFLAGSDRVAIDAVGVAILRMLGTTPEVSRGRIFDQEQIARAVELGIGVDSPEKIEIVTADAAGEEYAGQIRQLLLAG